MREYESIRAYVGFRKEGNNMIHVLVADDEKLARAGLRALLSREKDILIVAEARDGHEAIDLACKLAPDVIVMDIKMPVLDGLEATKDICGQKNHARIL